MQRFLPTPILVPDDAREDFILRIAAIVNNLTLAKKINLALHEALENVIKNNSDLAFKNFLFQLNQQVGEKNFLKIQRFISSYIKYDIHFEGKYIKRSYLFGAITYTYPGKILSLMTHCLENYKTNPDASTAAAPICKRKARDSNRKTLFIFLSLCISKSYGAPTKEMGSQVAMSCALRFQPKDYTWQQLCPFKPNTQRFVKEKASTDALNTAARNYIVFNNWPLTHTKIFVLAGTHGDSINKGTNPTAPTFRSTLETNAKIGDRILHEGMGFEKSAACAQYFQINPEAAFPARSDLLCQGWEISGIHSQVVKDAKDHLEMIKKITAEQHALNSENEQLQKNTLAALEKISGVGFESERNTLLKQTEERNKQLLEKYAELLKKATQQNKRFNDEEAMRIAARNRGIIQTVSHFLNANSDNRLWIVGGPAHFFRDHSIVKYNSTDHIAELRYFFENIEARGNPVAFFYSRNDTRAKAFLEELPDLPSLRG